MNRKPVYFAAAASAVGLWILLCLFSIVLLSAQTISLGTGLILVVLLLLLAGMLLIGFMLYQVMTELRGHSSGPEIELLLSREDSLLTEPFPDRKSVRREGELFSSSRLKGTINEQNAVISCGVYLHNLNPRAGRMPQVELAFKSRPRSVGVRFLYEADARPDSSLRTVQSVNHGKDHANLLLRLNDNLVLYQNLVYIGDMEITWPTPEDGKALPGQLAVEYRVYTLEGTTSGTVEASLEWGTSP